MHVLNSSTVLFVDSEIDLNAGCKMFAELRNNRSVGQFGFMRNRVRRIRIVTSSHYRADGPEQQTFFSIFLFIIRERQMFLITDENEWVMLMCAR